MIDGDLRVRVGDFGLAFFADTSSMSLGSHPGGCARWMAPELLKSLISRPNYACDVYSFGCTCVEVCLYYCYKVHPEYSHYSTLTRFILEVIHLVTLLLMNKLSIRCNKVFALRNP